MKWTDKLSAIEQEELRASESLPLADGVRVYRKLYMRVWAKDNPAKIDSANAQRRNRYHTTPGVKQMVRDASRKWKGKNRDKVSASYHRNKHKHKERISLVCAEYYKKNKTVMLKKRMAYNAKRLKENPHVRAMEYARTRVRNLVKGESRSASTMALIGCSREHLVKHIESQFKDGMNWSNYGAKGWHIDHILPCASFDLTNPDHQKICFHYTNLQPLWWLDNIKKHAKISSSDLVPS